MAGAISRPLFWTTQWIRCALSVASTNETGVPLFAVGMAQWDARVAGGCLYVRSEYVCLGLGGVCAHACVSCASTGPPPLLPLPQTRLSRHAQNLPPLEVVPISYTWHSTTDAPTPGMLTGSGAEVVVDDVAGNPVDPVWSPAVKGSEGDEAGSAYLFQRSGEQWVQVRQGGCCCSGFLSVRGTPISDMVSQAMNEEGGVQCMCSSVELCEGRVCFAQ